MGAELVKTEIEQTSQRLLHFSRLKCGVNRPLPSCLLPLCRNESSWKTIQMCFAYLSKTRFETEEQGLRACLQGGRVTLVSGLTLAEGKR